MLSLKLWHMYINIILYSKLTFCFSIHFNNFNCCRSSFAFNLLLVKVNVLAHPWASSFLSSFSSLQSMGSCVRHLLHHTGCVSKGKVKAVCIVYVSIYSSKLYEGSKVQKQSVSPSILNLQYLNSCTESTKVLLGSWKRETNGDL